jgi:hypothetical protein
MSENPYFNNSAFMTHFEDQFEAAVDQSRFMSKALIETMAVEKGREIKKTVDMRKMVGGYLLEKWTWFTGLGDAGIGSDSFTPPETCSHVDPLRPAPWMGLLNYPNKFWCMKCASDRVLLDEEKDAHVCDRCLRDNVHKFYDFILPLGNVQIVGSICGICVEKVDKSNV